MTTLPRWLPFLLLTALLFLVIIGGAAAGLMLWRPAGLLGNAPAPDRLFELPGNPPAPRRSLGSCPPGYVQTGAWHARDVDLNGDGIICIWRPPSALLSGPMLGTPTPTSPLPYYVDNLVP